MALSRDRLLAILAWVVIILIAGPVGGAVWLGLDYGDSPCILCWAQRTSMVLIALVVGLFVGVMLALLLERLDSTVKTSHDVEAKLGLPVLAALPVISDRKIKIERIFEQNPQAVFSEGIRTARTGILLSAIDEPHRALVITSSIPGEGKTTFAANLALAFAQTKRVVLVDADMRRPSIGKLFGKESGSPGLSSLVAASTPASECIFKVEGSELFVVPSGPIPPNPLELMLSKRFEEALYKLREMFELVIIDSPPVQLVSDSMVIARHCTGVIFVVKADDTPYQVARNAVKRMRMAQGNIIGVALNQLDFQRADRYYGEYTGYSKYGYKRYYGAYGGKLCGAGGGGPQDTTRCRSVAEGEVPSPAPPGRDDRMLGNQRARCRIGRARNQSPGGTRWRRRDPGERRPALPKARRRVSTHTRCRLCL